ncbi:MAG: hypothetical protein DHS20C18_05300 [Saprospiraceae bacterium]|nr:MAG: hypothetical protein DHS20C18_05300 [Saprospiraceae bacterium]
MKTLLKMIIGLLILVNMMACKKDDTDVIPIETDVQVQFGLDVVLMENAEPKEISISFSKKAKKDGLIKVAVNTDTPMAFHTEPAVSNGLLELPITKGDQSASFTITPVNNQIQDENRTIIFELSSVTEGFIIGTKKSFTLTITDDDNNELPGRAKSYETIGGGWRNKKTYLYDEAGRIDKILWETETPGLRTGTDTYEYGLNGLIERVNTDPDHDEYFIQENGKIVRSERYKNGIKVEYNEFDYDAAGNVGAQAQYFLQPSGEFNHAFTYVNLYYANGNIHKQLIYTPSGDPEEEDLLIRIKTYDGYSDKLNPFPTFEVIPGINGQPNLPGIFRDQNNGIDYVYHFSYEYRSDGLPIRRTITGNVGSPEVTTYTYY